MVSINLVPRSGNEALEVNPVDNYIGIHLTRHGSDWLWAAMSLFAVFAAITFLVYAFTPSTKTVKKLLWVFLAFINLVMTFAYFTYASNLGYTGIEAEFTGDHAHTDQPGNEVRQIFYSKFVAWFLALPGLLAMIEITTTNVQADLDLFQTVVRFLSHFIGKLLCGWVWVLGLLIGSLIRSTYKWGYFTFAAVGQLVGIILIGWRMYRSWSAVGTRGKVWLCNLVILLWFVVWLLQTIAWGCSEGGNRIQPTSEAIWYGVSDIVGFGIIPILMAWLLSGAIDDGVFTKFTAARAPHQAHHHQAHHQHTEKVNDNGLDETPRASGDTEVPVENSV